MLKRIIISSFAIIILNTLFVLYATAETSTYVQSFSNGSEGDGFTKYIPNTDTTLTKQKATSSENNTEINKQNEIPNIQVKNFSVKRTTRPMYYFPTQTYPPTGGMQVYTNPFSHGYNFGGEGPWVNTTPYYNIRPNYPTRPNVPPPSYKPNFPSQRPGHIHHRPVMPLNRNK